VSSPLGVFPVDIGRVVEVRAHLHARTCMPMCACTSGFTDQSIVDGANQIHFLALQKTSERTVDQMKRYPGYVSKTHFVEC